MKKAFKWFLFLTGAVLALFVLIFGFGSWAAHETGKRLDIGYGASTSPRLVRLEIGDKVFAIPQNHIWSREDWKGGRALGVNLQALLPDFEPYTEATQKEFEKPGWHQKIKMTLMARGVPGSLPASTGSMSRRENYTTNVARGQAAREAPGPFGLDRQIFHPEPLGMRKGEEVYVTTSPDGRFYWATCRPDGAVKSPSCHSSIEYSPHTYVRYSFSKSLLSDWQAIDEGVLGLIRQFEIDARQGG